MARAPMDADVLSELQRQTIAQREADIAAGRLLSEWKMQKRLGISAESLRNAIKEGRMFAVHGPSGENYYPAFFANRKKFGRAAIEAVCESLGDLAGNSKWSFFIVPRVSLGGTNPLQALINGKIRAVMNAARAYADQ